MIIMLLRRGIAIAVSLAIVFFAYNYFKDKGVQIPDSANPQSQIENAQDGVQQTQN